MYDEKFSCSASSVLSRTAQFFSLTGKTIATRAILEKGEVVAHWRFYDIFVACVMGARRHRPRIFSHPTADRHGSNRPKTD
jgi:hypothetical protein